MAREGMEAVLMAVFLLGGCAGKEERERRRLFILPCFLCAASCYFWFPRPWGEWGPPCFSFSWQSLQ